MRWQGGGRSATAISQGTRGLPAAARRGGTRKGRDPPHGLRREPGAVREEASAATRFVTFSQQL